MKLTTLLLATATAVCFALFPSTKFLAKKTSSEEQTEKVKFKKLHDKRTRADLAAAQNFEMTKDPELGTVPRERLMLAINKLRVQDQMRRKTAIANIDWTERGPTNVGGRTRAIMFDLKDVTHKKVFSAGVAGGLFVTDDVYDASPSWTAVDPYLDNMAVSTVAQHPINTDTMYFGTGEGFYNVDAVMGDGIFRSVDAGENWTQLSSTASNNDFSYVQKLVVLDNGYVLAACRSLYSNRGGLMRSTDHGSTWSRVLPSSTPYRAADVEVAANGDVYASIGLGSSSSSDDGIWKSTDDGATWTKVYTASSSHERIELACAPSNSNYIYAVIEISNAIGTMIKSTNGGSSWTAMSNVTWYDQCSGGGSTDFSRGQAWYDILAAVDPNDEDVFYVGGVDIFRTDDGGSSWDQITSWVGCGGYSNVHADQHTMVFAPGSSDTALVGNDGGIYASENASATTPAFSHQVNTYNTTQFYACAAHPDAGNDYFLAGAQDNGSHKFSSAGLNATSEVTGGDGAFCHIDQSDGDFQYTSYVYSYVYRSNNGGSSFGLISASNAGRFINPTDFDNDAEILYGAASSGQFWRIASAHTSTSRSTVSASWSGQVSAITCDQNTSNRVYFGTGNGEVYKVDNADNATTIVYSNITGGSMSGYVSSIAVETGDANHLLVTFSNYGVTSIWESTNAGSTWTSVEGNLPDMPVRWAVFSPIGGDSALIATELGVWSTDNLNGSSTNWAPSNDGLANVRVDMLQVRESDSTIVAATHGRGMFTYSFSEAIEPEFSADKTLAYPCESVQFTDVSIGATSWAWDFNNDGITDATTQNPTWTYSNDGYKTIKLVINGTDSITKTDYVQILPKVSLPYTTADGGDFESNPHHFGGAVINGGNQLWEMGTPSTTYFSGCYSGSKSWVTDLDNDITSGSYQCALYTPSFNFTNSGTYTLSFDLSMEVQYCNAPFAVRVEYSTNQGGTWTLLGNESSGTNWYNRGGSTCGSCCISSGIFSDNTGWTTTTCGTSVSHDVSTFSGNSDVRFRIVLGVAAGYGSGYSREGVLIDNFAISAPNNDESSEIETALNATSSKQLGPYETVSFYSSNCKLIATIENQDNFDYGWTTVTIDNAGSGTMDFSTNTSNVQEIMEKTIYIDPTTPNSSGNVKITTYYTSAEGSAWKTNTGWNYADLNQIKSSGPITSATQANTVYGGATIVDSSYNGSNIAVTAAYSNGFSGVGAGKGGAGGPLPIELISFSGTRNEIQSNLYWSTASEINSSHFDVERLDGSEYVKIAQVKASGNSNQIIEYSAIDDNPDVMIRPEIFYRLKMVDFDGSYKYSKIIVLSINQKEISFTVGPNPSTDFIEITMSETSSNKYDIEIFNLDGVKIKEINGFRDKQRLDISKNATGLYFVSVSKNGILVETKRIVIVR